MLDVSQATSLLQSLGISSSVANKAVERSAQSAGTDAQAFLKILQQNLKELTASTPSSASAGAVPSQLSTGTSSASQAENATNAAATASPLRMVLAVKNGSSIAAQIGGYSYINKSKLSRIIRIRPIVG